MEQVVLGSMQMAKNYILYNVDRMAVLDFDCYACEDCVPSKRLQMAILNKVGLSATYAVIRGAIKQLQQRPGFGGLDVMDEAIAFENQLASVDGRPVGCRVCWEPLSAEEEEELHELAEGVRGETIVTNLQLKGFKEEGPRVLFTDKEALEHYRVALGKETKVALDTVRGITIPADVAGVLKGVRQVSCYGQLTSLMVKQLTSRIPVGQVEVYTRMHQLMLASYFLGGDSTSPIHSAVIVGKQDCVPSGQAKSLNLFK